MYEGGTLVPACAVWPGVIPAEKTTSVRCATVDFFPTIGKICGYSLTSKDKRPIDGIDLMPVISGTLKTRGKDLFFGYRRLVLGVDGKAIISGNYKLMKEAKKKGRVRRYDLAKDPHEENDHSKKRPELMQKLKRQLEELEKSCLSSRDGADYRY